MLATPKKIHHSHVRQQESIMNSKAVLVFASIFNASHWRYLYEQATIVSMDFRLFVAKRKIVYIQFHSFTVNKPKSRNGTNFTLFQQIIILSYVLMFELW